MVCCRLCLRRRSNTLTAGKLLLCALLQRLPMLLVLLLLGWRLVCGSIGILFLLLLLLLLAVHLLIGGLLHRPGLVWGLIHALRMKMCRLLTLLLQRAFMNLLGRLALNSILWLL